MGRKEVGSLLMLPFFGAIPSRVTRAARCGCDFGGRAAAAIQLFASRVRAALLPRICNSFLFPGGAQANGDFFDYGAFGDWGWKGAPGKE